MESFERECACTIAHGQIWPWALPQLTVKWLTAPRTFTLASIYSAGALLIIGIAIVLSSPLIAVGTFVPLIVGIGLIWRTAKTDVPDHAFVAANILVIPQKHETFTWAANHTCDLLRYAAAKNSNTPEMLVSQLALDSNSHVAWAALNNPMCSTRARTLGTLTTQDPGPWPVPPWTTVKEGQSVTCSKCQEFRPAKKTEYAENVVCLSCDFDNRMKELDKALSYYTWNTDVEPN